MKRIEAIIQPEKTDALIEKLAKIGVNGLNLSEVRGFGAQKGHSEDYSGSNQGIRLRKKTKIEIIVKYTEVDKIVEAMKDTLKTGEIGDGKIFISDIENVIRVRTGEEGHDAL